MGPLSDGGGDAEDDALPDLDQSDLPGPSTSAARPPEKRARLTAKSKKVWKWERTDLEPRELPTSQVRPKNVENCRYEVQMFLEMMGSDNIDLITTQTNLKRTKLAIEKNRPIPAITEREIRQWLGILMYMSVVSMPATHLHWNRSVRNEAVAGVMTRDRFREISSVIHLSDNDLQPERNTPGYDRLFKVRQFLTNINKQFRHLATIEEVQYLSIFCTVFCSVLYCTVLYYFLHQNGSFTAKKRNQKTNLYRFHTVTSLTIILQTFFFLGIECRRNDDSLQRPARPQSLHEKQTFQVGNEGKNYNSSSFSFFVHVKKMCINFYAEHFTVLSAVMRIRIQLLFGLFIFIHF